MAQGIEVKLEGGEVLLRALRQAPDMVADELHRFALAVTVYLESEIKDHTPAVHGLLRASIVGRAASRSGIRNGMLNGVLGVVGSSNAYAVPVELGTKPHFPPVQALEDWVQARLGIRGAEVRRVAFLVARKIARVGTKGAFMFRDGFAAARPELERQFDLTVARIGQRLAGGAA